MYNRYYVYSSLCCNWWTSHRSDNLSVSTIADNNRGLSSRSCSWHQFVKEQPAWPLAGSFSCFLQGFLPFSLTKLIVSRELGLGISLLPPLRSPPPSLSLQGVCFFSSCLDYQVYRPGNTTETLMRIQRNLSMWTCFGTQHFVLCREVVLFQRLFCTEFVYNGTFDLSFA